MSRRGDITARVKERHAYDTWRGTNTLEESLFIWRFFLAGDELPRWETDSVRRIVAPGQPPLVQSVWKQAGRAHSDLLVLDTYECPSRLGAHEFLVQYLSQFQSPAIGRRADIAAGDVAFGRDPVGLVERRDDDAEADHGAAS